ncbi:MAG: sigma-54 dependent transcriptional regulator [Acidobacteriota bacterium]
MTVRETILTVDDEPTILIALRRLLEGCGYRVLQAGSGEEALEILADAEPDLIITDLTLEPMSGLDLLHHIRSRAENSGGEPPPVIMVTAYGSERSAVEAMKAGAVDYLPKPFDNDELALVVRRVLEERRLRRELERLREEVDGRHGFHRLVGRSPAMRKVFERIEKVADTDLTVLVRGPSGTGKELVANAIHFKSGRRRGPLVQVNCAAFSQELVESELFGHEQGAFTGAHRQRRGKFETADGGTLFLDEIGDMSLGTQAKVLRVLQEKRFERVGGSRTLEVDVRVVAATNQDLEALIERGAFRRDLYYRLNVVTVELPSLLERPEDLTLLIDHFLDKASRRLGRARPSLDGAATQALARHGWPGNVRELEHAIEHAVALCSDGRITPDDLPGPVAGAASDAGPLADVTSLDFKAAKQQVVDAFERRFLSDALRRHGGNITRAAEELGMYRQHLQLKISKLGLDADDFR